MNDTDVLRPLVVLVLVLCIGGQASAADAVDPATATPDSKDAAADKAAPKAAPKTAPKAKVSQPKNSGAAKTKPAKNPRAATRGGPAARTSGPVRPGVGGPGGPNAGMQPGFGDPAAGPFMPDESSPAMDSDQGVDSFDDGTGGIVDPTGFGGGQGQGAVFMGVIEVSGPVDCGADDCMSGDAGGSIAGLLIGGGAGDECPPQQ